MYEYDRESFKPIFEKRRGLPRCRGMRSFDELFEGLKPL